MKISSNESIYANGQQKFCLTINNYFTFKSQQPIIIMFTFLFMIILFQVENFSEGHKY